MSRLPPPENPPRYDELDEDAIAVKAKSSVVEAVELAPSREEPVVTRKVGVGHGAYDCLCLLNRHHL